MARRRVMCEVNSNGCRPAPLSLSAVGSQSLVHHQQEERETLARRPLTQASPATYMDMSILLGESALGGCSSAPTRAQEGPASVWLDRRPSPKSVLADQRALNMAPAPRSPPFARRSKSKPEAGRRSNQEGGQSSQQQHPVGSTSEPNLHRLVLSCAASLAAESHRQTIATHRPLEAHQAVAAFRQLAIERFSSDLQSLSAVASAIQQQQQQEEQHLAIQRQQKEQDRQATSRQQQQQAPRYSALPGQRQTRKCRRMYGMERRRLWCTQCKWKKACSRYSAPRSDGARTSGSQPAGAQLEPTGLGKLSGHH